MTSQIQAQQQCNFPLIYSHPSSPRHGEAIPCTVHLRRIRHPWQISRAWVCIGFNVPCTRHIIDHFGDETDLDSPAATATVSGQVSKRSTW